MATARPSVRMMRWIEPAEAVAIETFSVAAEDPAPTSSPRSTQLDFGMVMKLIDVGRTEADKSQGEEIILFVGPTGSGKSTAINYLAGSTIRLVQDEETGESTIQVDDPVVAVGDGAQSKTLYPAIVEPRTDETYRFCDTAGFGDNRGAEYDICAAYTLGSVFEKARTIRGIAILVSIFDLIDPRLVKVLDTFRLLDSLLTDPDSYRGSLLFLVTKPNLLSPPRTQKQIVNLLTKRWNQLRDPQPGTGAAVDTSGIDWLFESMLGDEGKMTMFCDPLDMTARTVLVDTLKGLAPVRNASSNFMYPISDGSKLSLTELIVRRKQQFETSLDEYRSRYRDFTEAAIREPGADLQALTSYERMLGGVISGLETLGNSPPASELLALFPRSSENDALSAAHDALADELALIDDLNHFFGDDDAPTIVSNAAVGNFRTDFDQLSQLVGQQKVPFFVARLETLLGSRAVQSTVWTVRERMSGALTARAGAVSITDCAPLLGVEGLSPEVKREFEEALSALNAGGVTGQQRARESLFRFIERPFTIPTLAQIKAKALVIKANVPDIALSQVVAALRPMRTGLAATEIRLYVAGVLWLDSDLPASLAGGRNVVLAANRIETVSESRIDTSGAKPPESRGPHGAAGQAGHHAGSVLLIAEEGVHGYPLSLVALGSSGARGFDGVDGGKGDDGADGKHAVSKGGMGDFSGGDEKTYDGTPGKSGTDGGSGTDAGAGGPGGLGGRFSFLPGARPDLITTLARDGQAGPSGRPGRGGAGGAGGYNGYSIYVVKPNTFYKTRWYRGYFTEARTEWSFSKVQMHIQGDYTTIVGGDSPPTDGPKLRYAARGHRGPDGSVARNAPPMRPRLPDIDAKAVSAEFAAFRSASG